MQFSNWLALRRVRTALFLGLLIALLFLTVPYSSLPERLPNLTPYIHHNATKADPVPAPVESRPAMKQPVAEPEVRWSDFAYVQYVTNSNYLCNSLMILESLHRLQSKADRIMMYPEDWKVPVDNGSDASFESELLAQARDQYGTKLVPIQIQRFENKQDPTWQDSYTKLLAFNQTQYKRIISLDSDATVRQHMDELFLLPSAPVAMPRAYWGDNYFLSSQLVVIEPSEAEWKRIEYAIEHHEDHDYDMDILHKEYGKSAIVIPHRKYDLLTGEFRGDKHESYLGNKYEKWDPKKILEEAKFVHFSDWPLPKPWLQPQDGDEKKSVEANQPKCKEVKESNHDCSDQEVWLGVYEDFRQRRQRICGREYDGMASHSRLSRSDEPMERPRWEPAFA